MEALKILHDRRPEARWTATIAGDGHVQALRETVDRSGLKRRVSVPGWLDRTATEDLLREADVFVLPSVAEGLPTAILEAMSLRTAVVTTPVGAIPEVINHGINGLLVPVSNADQLADAIQALVDDPSLRRRLADAGYETWATHHNMDDYASTFMVLYRDIL